jgi:RHS repeat-associated protein
MGDSPQFKGLSGAGQERAPSTGAPSISLPKGGGAIRGIGEKFAANPVTGTGSMSVPIATSPGRGGFGPQLSLTYDSGAGNGPFGFGWGLALPAITRKTDKGLPQYFDAEESDVFLLSGAEDLVPVFKKDASGDWIKNAQGRFVFDEVTIDGYRVRRYRPRIEGLFARIERWTDVTDPTNVHWRSISKDNILTLYGKDSNSRICDPNDPRRIFSWLICETRDDKGNAVVYGYKPEDGAGVDLAQAHERNRGERDSLQRTANRYLKRILYGNRVPLLNDAGKRPRFLTQDQLDNPGWMFEVVLDYGEHDAEVPQPGDDPATSNSVAWPVRLDPFSSYRAGFEVRTYRLCQRVLMFHHFPGEPSVGANCLVRSTDFTYSYEENPSAACNPIYSFLLSVTQSGYKRQNGGYLKRSLPPVEFEYSQPVVQDKVQEVDVASLENLPSGVDGAAYQWTDLHGEGIPGILTEQAGGWFYKRNVSPINVKQDYGGTHVEAQFAPIEPVQAKPNLALAGGAQFMDLAGDGQPDLAVLDGSMPGLYEHDDAEGWQPFRPFTARLNRDLRDPNLKLVDLDGDGHADVLITEDDAFVWHASLAEEGFDAARRVHHALNEEKGPRLVFADGTQSIYLADLSGDGLTDLARIRNGEVCYWPNLGYGLFGAKVTMDHAPWFDNPDQFNQKRIRLADIDGSGTTDIIYLGRDGVRLYFNQSGNGWSAPQALGVFPRVDDLVAITPTDLLGNGTACLVWSSPLPGDARRQMRYVNLMGGTKPHLLVKTVNNLGAQTRVTYAPSTKFYLQDKWDGNPWITRLPFPVHVVERVETYDYISRNRFVTRYAYHHGYFDGEEREFRGFGMVEQWDTEEFAALTASGELPVGDNVDASSHVPPVLTRTWFHTGIYLGRDRVSRFFAGLLDGKDRGEYYREPDWLNNPEEADERLLPDTILPDTLSLEEEREACRTLKGSMLRQEVYALDGIGQTEDYPDGQPYTVAEQNFSVRLEQPRGDNRHAVFYTHPREALTYHYERESTDPRIQHALTLEVDDFGNVLKEVAIGYGRRQPDSSLPLQADRDKQTQLLITYTENCVTNPVDDVAGHPDDYRTPLPCETRTYELTGFKPENNAVRFSFDEWTRDNFALPASASEILYEQKADNVSPQKRLIERVRTVYRKDDLTALLSPGELGPLALPGESYKLAFTPGLLTKIYRRPLDGVQPPGSPAPESLLPNPANVLGDQGEDEGGYVAMDGGWWIPSGRVFHSPGAADPPDAELAEAQAHFFLPRRFRDLFGHDTIVDYDGPANTALPRYDLLVARTEDALHNVVSAENDYRVLGPWRMTDPNCNRTEVVFDALRMVAGTAVMGKAGEDKGDLLDEHFESDLTQAQIDGFFDAPDPHVPAPDLLQHATTRIVYDLERFHRSKQDYPYEPEKWLPVYDATLARETHVSDPLPPGGLKIQISFSYSDGYGREIQKKIQAEPGEVEVEDATGNITVVDTTPNLRWVGSGWTIFNNKGKPVRQYEPFFSTHHRFQFGKKVGVSPVLFYDPVERVVATLHPNHTWEKVVFDPWQQTTYDVNDTVLNADGSTDPKLDDDVKGFFSRLPDPDYLPTWYEQRVALAADDPERVAAEKAAVHRQTPAVVHFDALGRPFLTIAQNRFKRENPDGTIETVEENYPTRVELDIEGNQRAVIDAKDRVVMRYDYDMLGSRVHQASMEAGERWMLNDVAGKLIQAWDSRGFARRLIYDSLRRPTGLHVTENGVERLAERTVYGEPQGDASNHRTRVYQVCDAAGVVTSEAYDFKGNLLASKRDLLPDYKQAVDWEQNPVPDDGTFPASTTYDALNRPLTITTPDGSIYRPAFNEANLLDKVEVNLRGAAVATPFVSNINYNAKGQRTLIVYANGAQTTYDYDPLTFRLTHLGTTRPATPDVTASQLFKSTEVVQDLRYTYDPVGNITRIEDAALKTVHHDNQTVEPVCSYTYDAIYRLIEAQGREHIGQTAFDFTPPDDMRRDFPFMGLRANPNDPEALRNCTETYQYDEVGNFDHVSHSANGGSWTRMYVYDEDSLIADDAGKKSNRLTRTTVGNGVNHVESYTYDVHGNMTSMNSLGLVWNFEDQLQRADLGGGGAAYYIYDAAGQRVRKVIDRQNGIRRQERIYLGGFEVYREYNGSGATVSLERETLHIMDDKQRIALVETRTQGGDPAPQQLIRYQLGNHLGSASLELDDQAQIISYEEYTPYGSTSYQGVRSQTETPKRYRFTGKERDEESGLYYHGARYYAPWLARWVICDPIELLDGVNAYLYAKNNPVRLLDQTGSAGITFEAKDKNDTEIMEAGVHMAHRMQIELREYFGIATTVSPVYSTSSGGCYGSPMQTKVISKIHVQLSSNLSDLADAEAAFRMRIENELKTSNRYSPEEVNRIVEALEPIRSAIKTKLSASTDVELAREVEGKALLLGNTDPKRLFTSTTLNPFSWFLRDAKTSEWVEAMSGTGRGKVALGPALMVIHELVHLYDKTFEEEEPAGSTVSTTQNRELNSIVGVTARIDYMIRRHPGIAQRGWYPSSGPKLREFPLAMQDMAGHSMPVSQQRALRPDEYQHLPGKRYVLGHGGWRYPEGTALPNDTDWVRWPGEQELRTGIRP